MIKSSYKELKVEKSLYGEPSEKDLEIEFIKKYPEYVVQGNHENEDFRIGISKDLLECQIEFKKTEDIDSAIVQCILNMAKNKRLFMFAAGINFKEQGFIVVNKLLENISFASLLNICNKPSSRGKEFNDVKQLLITNENWKKSFYKGIPSLETLKQIEICRKVDRHPEFTRITTNKKSKKGLPFWSKDVLDPDPEILDLVKRTIKTQQSLEAYYTPSCYEKESLNLMKKHGFKFPCDPSCGKDAIFVINKFSNFIASDIDEKICNSIIIHRDLKDYEDIKLSKNCDCYYTNPPFSKIEFLINLAKEQKRSIGLYMPVYKLPKKPLPCLDGFLMWSQINWSLGFKFLLGFFIFDFSGKTELKDSIELDYLPTNEKFKIEFKPPKEAYIFNNCIKGPQRFGEDSWNNLKDSPFRGKIVYKNKLFRKYTGTFIKEEYIKECEKPEYDKYKKKLNNSGGGKKPRK